MRFLKDPSTTPPGGFVHEEKGATALGPGTGEIWSEASIDLLFNRLIAWLRANNHPVPPDLQQRLIDEQCARNPSLCKEADGTPLVGAKVLSGFGWQEVVGAARVFGEAIKTKWQGRTVFVSDSEAARRSAICATCPHNVQPDDCAPCGLASALASVLSWTGNRSTPNDSRLNACASCGCFLQAKIHLKREVLQAHTTLRQPYAPQCWMLNETE